MYLTVNKTLSLRGEATPPGSKSQSIRGMVFALLARGESTLFNILDSDDSQVAMQVCAALGASVKMSPSMLTINSEGLPLATSSAEINTGNSGITTRFILPILGLRANHNTPIRLDCGEQMRGRPIKSLVAALTSLGMRIQYLDEDGRLPLSVTGKLKGGNTEVEGITSQYLSALLISLPCAENDSVITVRDLHERPYVEMTLAWLKQQCIAYTHKRTGNVDIFNITGRQRYEPVHAVIKGDFSSASCLFAAAALLDGEVVFKGLDNEDSQGDKRLISILQEMGADIVTDHETIKIRGNKPLHGRRIDANDIPDLVPALAVIATQARGKTEIHNVLQARIKETDRIHSMIEGLRKMGAKIDEHQDGMTVYPCTLQGAFVKGYGDHRTVMALSVAGMIAQGTTVISNGEAVNKTYPAYVETMKCIGADMLTVNEHIILIGFKHVGKTLIGQQLAKVLNKVFIDLDNEVESLYQKRHQKMLTCRQIMQLHGEAHYRELESETLQAILKSSPCVISLGGGTALSQHNQDMIKMHKVLHVTAPRGIVFERIMVAGRPAFFDPNEDPYESFTRLWNERDKIYRKLTSCAVDNSQTVERAVNEAINHLQDRNSYA